MDVFISGSRYPVAETKHTGRNGWIFQWIATEEKFHPVVFAAQLHKDLSSFIRLKTEMAELRGSL